MKFEFWNIKKWIIAIKKKILKYVETSFYYFYFVFAYYRVV